MTPSSPPSEPPRRNTRVYGRRLGRPLRAGRQELLSDLLPRLRLSVADGAGIDPAALFPGKREVWLELGFGGGEHLAAQAEAHPDVGVIGTELFLNGIGSLLRHVRDRQLTNVRVADIDSFRLIGALAPASIARVFLLFPDPWPKVRHHRRRFVRDESLDLVARLLRDGGEFRFATDHADYCTWALARIVRHPAFAWAAESPADWRERPPDWPATRYEQRALAAGRKPVFLSFFRRPRRLGGGNLAVAPGPQAFPAGV